MNPCSMVGHDSACPVATQPEIQIERKQKQKLRIDNLDLQIQHFFADYQRVLHETSENKKYSWND